MTEFTFADLTAVLMELGFTHRFVPGSRLYFRHEAADTCIVLRRTPTATP